MEDYKFAVILNGNSCDELITVSAENYDQAIAKAQQTIIDGLESFPIYVSFDVEYRGE